jgi:myo-inositol-1(or 4)-monophosphatase
VTAQGSDLDVALAAASAGARELMSRYRSEGIRDAARSKGLRRDLVTDADQASEAAVLEVIRRARPGDAIVAEESAAKAAAGRRTWIVDPLDGTVNFAHGIPVFCVSIGLVVDGAPTVGVVHAPRMNELFAGEVGRGATLNGAPIRVSATTVLADAVLATGFAYDIENLADDNLEQVITISKRARGIRRLGSAAMDLAWVAAGRLDGFWEIHLSPWDVAGGVAVVRAAGGRVTDMAGGDDWLYGKHIAATGGAFHDELLSVLKRPSFAKR